MFNFFKKKDRVLHVKELVAREECKSELVLKAVYEYGDKEIENIPAEMFEDAEFLGNILEYHPECANLIPPSLVYWYKADVGCGAIEWHSQKVTGEEFALEKYFENPSIFHYLPVEYAFAVMKFESGDKKITVPYFGSETELYPTHMQSKLKKETLLGFLGNQRPDAVEMLIKKTSGKLQNSELESEK